MFVYISAGFESLEYQESVLANIKVHVMLGLVCHK